MTNSSSKSLSLTSKALSTAYSLISGLAFRPNGTVNRRLLNIADIKSPPSASPIAGVKTSDHTIDASRDLWFRLFVPVDAPSSLPLLIYFHGGGFVAFSPSTRPLDALCRRLSADTAAIVISVNYRLSPEHRCPAPYDDGIDVLKFIDTNRDKIDGFPANADLGHCFLAGDSAGGNIAHHVAVRAAESEFDDVRIRGIVAIQPFFGGEERTDVEMLLDTKMSPSLKRTDFYWKAFLPIGSDRDHPASNVFGPNWKELPNLKWPPVMVVIGGRDLLQDWQKRYCEGSGDCGVSEC